MFGSVTAAAPASSRLSWAFSSSMPHTPPSLLRGVENHLRTAELRAAATKGEVSKAKGKTTSVGGKYLEKRERKAENSSVGAKRMMLQEKKK